MFDIVQVLDMTFDLVHNVSFYVMICHVMSCVLSYVLSCVVSCVVSCVMSCVVSCHDI